MPRVSQNFITPDIQKEVLSFLEETFTLLNSQEKSAGFLRQFFTREERLMLAKRLAIGVFLKQGWHYASICRLLKVSATTVRRVQNSLEDDGTYEKYVLPIIEKKRSDKKWQKLDHWLDALRLPMKGSPTDMRRWKKAMRKITP